MDMLEVGKHVIRTSDRIQFKRCRRSWDFSSFTRMNVRPEFNPKPLDFGIALHEAWGVYYDPDFWHIPRESIMDTAIAKFLATCDEQLKTYRDRGLEMDYELEKDFNERKDLGVNMLQHYVKWAKPLDNFTPVRVEYDFEVPIIDPDTGEQMYCVCPEHMDDPWQVVYRGRIDGIVKDELGFYWILEHKTAGILGDPGHLVLDEQCTSYAWALLHYGIRVKGVIYNEALKDYPTPPTRLVNTRQGRNYSVNKQQRTTYDVYLQTLIDNDEDISLYEDILQYFKDNGNPYFRRTQVHRNEYELKNLGIQVAYEARDHLRPDLHIYPNPSRINCGGCSYKQPCIMMNDGSDWEWYIKEFFVEGKPR